MGWWKIMARFVAVSLPNQSEITIFPSLFSLSTHCAASRFTFQHKIHLAQGWSMDHSNQAGKEQLGIVFALAYLVFGTVYLIFELVYFVFGIKYF